MLRYRTCLECGEDFLANDETEVYCSVNCQPLYRHKKCRACGKDILAYEYQEFCDDCEEQIKGEYIEKKKL